MSNTTAHVVRCKLLEAENKQLKKINKGLEKDIGNITESLANHRKISQKAGPPAKSLPKRRGDKIRVIFGDSHGAKVNKPALAAMLADIKAMNPDEVIMLGDHVDCGGFLAQHHVLGYVAETEISYEEDVAAANQLLDSLQNAAPRARIHFLEGNHDRRVETWAVNETLKHRRDSEMLRRAFAPEFLLKLKERDISYYRQSTHYDGLPIPGTIRLGKCYFWHGTSAAKHAAAANVAKVGGNIVFGHCHRMQSFHIRPVATGEISGWNPGCLCELAPLWQHTNPNDWTHGYAVQIVSKSEMFLHVNVPIMNGESLLGGLASAFSK